MKEPGLVSDSLPEGVPAESTVSELEEMACRQQQQIESQRQLLAAKEQRLRFLKQHEAKHQLVATEHERLRRLRQKVETQEQKLRKLRALRGQVDQTKLNNVSLTSDLESIRALFNEKEKELSIAVAKVEELTRQLEELQRGRDSNSNQVASSVAAVELEKLRSELLYRNKLNEQHSARLTHQRELLAQRQKEMTAIDRRIGELQERLHRKRMLNQQLAHHVNNKQKQNRDDQKFVAEQIHQPSLSQNQPFQKCLQFQQQQQQLQQLQLLQKQQKLHQMQQLQLQKQHQHQQMQTPTSPPGFNNLSVMCKIVPAKATGHTNAVTQGMCSTTKHAVKMSGPGTNIAAVQPYHHVPSVKSNQQSPAGASLTAACDHNKRGSLKSDQLDSMSPFGQQIVVPSSYLFACQKDAKPQPATEEHRPAVAVGFSAEARPEEGRVAEFRPYKFDSKYQTLPTGGVSQYGATSRYDCCRPAEGVVESVQAVGVPVSNQKFASNDKRLTNDGCGGFNNRVDDGVNGSAEMNEASQSSDGGDDGGVDTATKNSANVGTAGSGQQQQQQPPAHIHPMNIVRSTHIQTTTNKGLATSPSNASYAARCIASSVNNLSRYCEASPFVGYSDQSLENHSVTVAVTCSSTVVTYTSTYQKPVSSVSPIYQTSSTRILPVQPQIIGSFSAAFNQQQENREARKSYSQNGDAVGSYPSKPALPPKPAPPAKATPPPPPRQSAFHSQLVCQTESDSCDQQAAFADNGRDDGDPVVDANGNTELESLVAELDLEERADAVECHSRANVVVRTSTNTNNARNGLGFALRAVVSPRKSDSPPPLPNVEPPSDDDLDRATESRPIYVRNTDDKNNNNYSNNGARHSISQLAVDDRLVSDASHDSSCSDTSSAENNYAAPSNGRGVELPAAYLLAESGTRLRDLVAVDAQSDVDVMSSVESGDQPNADVSANGETSPRSSSPNSDGSARATNAFNESREDTKKLKKGNLKNRNSANSKRRVSFDPLALLLDASLEGELELVVRTAEQVKNPSAANDEGITALHNAICAGHFEIVKFLVQFGCDVNAQDSDGWTPLHCAASCNNLPMVRFLVEHGACIFATTLSDQETAAEKCEEDEEGFDGCSEFLYSVQEKLGILNNGVVHAVFDYEAHNPDELSFNDGDRLTVLRKGDEWEREWWWSRLFDKEGYVPRNLLGLYPRIRGNVNTSNLRGD